MVNAFRFAGNRTGLTRTNGSYFDGSDTGVKNFYNGFQPKRITMIVTGGFTLVLFPESTPPSGGVLFQPPFLYYTVGAQARHVDVQQGFGEAMTSFTGPVFPGAVADR